MPLIPTGELVAVAWLESADIPAGLALPRDASTWAGSGFVEVSTVGGNPNRDVPIYNPVISVDCWAVDPHSSRPPWRKANQLAEFVKAAGFGNVDAENSARRRVSISGYYDADAQAYAFFEPRPVTSDEARFAHYQFDVQFHFIPLVGAI